MAAAMINYVEEINSRTMLWKIKVHVVLLWKQYYNNNPNKVASIDMILRDEKGNKINATIMNVLVSKFECVMQEGGMYMISNFEVKGNSGVIRLANHPSKIYFHEDTLVRSCTDYTCSVDVFNFVSFKKVLDQTIDKSLAFDVIGQVISNKDIRVTHVKGQTKKILEFELQNLSDEKVACALWDEHAKKLHTYISENKEVNEPIIIVIQLAKFNTWRKQPQVSNCMFGTKIHINDDTPIISSFRKSLQEKKGDGSMLETKIQLSDKTIYTNPADYFTNFSLKNINELIDIQECTGCVVIAKIKNIKTEQGWYYLACRKCDGKVVKTEDTNVESETENTLAPFQCSKCKGVSDVYNRMKVQIEVEDNTGTISFWLFQREVIRLINKSATYLLGKINKDEDFYKYPEELNTMLQKRCVFKIKISSFNIEKKYHIYTVDKATTDPDVINVVLENSTDHAKENDNANENETIGKITQMEKSEDSTSAINMVTNITSATDLKRMRDNKDDDLLIISSTSNIAQEQPKLKIPKVEKD